MINTSLFALFGRYKGDASLAGVLENIQRGTYKQFIDETREALASGDKELAAKLKKKLPAFTPQATYSGKRLDPHITRYNQLVVLDIDHVGERELERITPLATEAPYTVAYFRSPSGDGAKLIAYAATDETATPGNHRRVYEAMSRWYAARLGVELDTSGSDIGRLCFVSDDPALYLSPAYRSWLEGTGELPEGLALFRRGEKYWFSGEDIRKINENNETFRQRSPEEELFFTYFRKPERFDTPQYLTASDIMTKLSVFTRITPTRSNIVTLSKVLKKHGFKLTTIRGKRLFEVVEITPEQVKDNFLSTPEEKGTKKEDEKNHTDNQNNTANPKLPF